MSTPPAPVTHPARHLLEALDDRIDGLRHFGPTNTREAIWYNVRLATLRELRKLVAESLPDVEIEAVQRAMPGQTVDVVHILLGVGEPVDDSTLQPLPWAEGVAVSA